MRFNKMDSACSIQVIDSRIKQDESDYNLTEIPFHLFEFFSSSACNRQNLCRICLTTDNEIMFSLFSTEDNFANMFTSLTAIELSSEDGFPNNICASCRTRIVSSYKFKIQCEDATRILKSILKCFTKDEPIDNIMMSSRNVPGTNNVKEGEIKQEDDILKTEVEENLHDIPEANKKMCIKPHSVIKGKGLAFNAKITAGKISTIKEESDVSNLEDVEYLEDVIPDEKSTLCMLPYRTKRKKRKVTVTVTDSETLLKEIVSEQRVPEKIKRKTYSCKICSKNFYKANLLRAHINNYHQLSEQEFPCNQCKDSFVSDHDLKLHLSLHSKGATWSCNKCEKMFDSKSLLRRHIYRHMESKRYSCETCGKLFTELYALRRHARVHTGETLEKKHECHLCDKKYSESGLLAAHIAKHKGIRPCVCSACGKAFPSARLLASHALTHSDAKPYACSYCDKRFRHESTRNIHHRTHTGEKPYVCSTCGKTFIQNSNLTLHMRTHTGEKPYSCSMCSRKFSSGSSLKSHERTHTGERPYECNICRKKFARFNLRAHMRLHTGERPYACNMCPKKFVNAARLRDHSRVHTGEKPFECAMCPKKFPTKSYLVRHVKKHQSARKLGKKQQVQDSSGIITDKKQTVDEVRNEDATEDCGAIVFDIKEVPIEVEGELVLQDDSDVKTELLVIDRGQNYQTENILNANGMIVSDINYPNNIVAVNEGDGNVATSSALLEGATVKLYQLDQSLLQIHSAGGQLTISKITSKMTANF